MDANWLLSIIVLLSSGSLMLRGRAQGAQRSGMVRIATALVVLDIGLMALLPDHGGYVVGALWFGLVLVPLLLMRRVQRAASAQDFSAAERLLTWVARLHPGDELRGTRALFTALAAAQGGETARARTILAQLAQVPGPHRLRAHAELLRIDQRWQELLLLGFDPAFERESTLDPSVLPLWLRALGECGRRAQLVTEWPLVSAKLRRPGLETALDAARLVLFAFAGRFDAVDELVRERLPLLPEDSAAFWRATALSAAGEFAQAQAECERHLSTPRHETRKALELRRSQPLPSTPAPNEAELVAAELNSAREDARYAVDALGKSYRAPCTRGLIIVLLAVFAVELYHGNTTSGRDLYELGAFLEPAVLEEGQWWRLFTFQLLHAGPLHLLMNVLALNLLGRDVERRVGAFKTALVFVCSGTFCGLLALALTALGIREPQLMVGASGGIMGFVGATVAVFLRGHAHERSAVATRRLKQAITLVALQTLLDFLTPQLSMLAHLSGVFAGFVVTLLITRRGTADGRYMRSSRNSQPP